MDEDKFTYYFLQNGEVLFIEQFYNVDEAKEFRDLQFPNTTLAVRVQE